MVKLLEGQGWMGKDLASKKVVRKITVKKMRKIFHVSNERTPKRRVTW